MVYGAMAVWLFNVLALLNRIVVKMSQNSTPTFNRANVLNNYSIQKCIFKIIVKRLLIVLTNRVGFRFVLVKFFFGLGRGQNEYGRGNHNYSIKE